MTELFSTAKTVTTFHEASELIYVPATTLAVWTAYHNQIISHTFNITSIAIFFCSFLVFLMCIGLYNVLCFISGFLYKYPVFPFVSVLMLSMGTIFLFQNTTDYLNQFIGISLLSWGCLLDLVSTRIRENEYKNITSKS